MKNPCKRCITLAICIARSKKKTFDFMLWAVNNCKLYHDYVIVDCEVVNFDHANELGQLFGYEITDEGTYKEL